MEEKIKVLGTAMDCLTAKEAMLRTMQFMETEPVDTIEIISMDTLMSCQEDEKWKEQAESLSLVLPGEIEILEAAGVHDRVKRRDTENRIFLKLFLKYLQKNHRKVFLLAEREDEIIRVENAVGRYNRGIKMTGHALLVPEENREEEVINEINGTETDCILSVLSSPYQEEFIARNKTLLNARVWFGCGSLLGKSFAERGPFRCLRHFFLKSMFRRRVASVDREEEQNSV